MVHAFRILLLSVSIALANSAYAIDPIPDEVGWSGFVRLGAGGLQAKTNMVEGIDRYGIEIGNSSIDSLDDSPDSEPMPVPQANLNLKYTFATQTQVFTGNSMEDIVQLDLVSTFGVRQQFDDRSILEFSSVSSPAYGPIQVWSDPYVVGEKRKETDRSSRGLRLEYDKIMGSGFGLQYTRRETEIDDELSGTTQLGLTGAEAALLDREGTTEKIVGSYRFKPVGRNIYDLSLGLSADDLDGKAMEGDATEINFTHAYLGDRYITAVNAFIITKDFNARNPVFDKTRNDDTLGLAFFVFDKQLFENKDWWGQASIVWVEQDSNIDFYDQSSIAVIAGVQRNF